MALSISCKDWGYRHASRKGFAARHMTLEIAAGERVLLLGPSGAGKSTLLAGIAGLIGAAESATDDEGGETEGELRVGTLLPSDVIGKVGLILQDPDAQAIFQRIGDNVAFGPENQNVPKAKIWPRTEQALREVGLEDLELSRSCAHTSGGQMQRIALAGALAMRPEVLLLDEPTANLDPEGVTQVVDAVKRAVDATGATLLVVEHRTDAWIDVVNRVIVMGKNGQIIADGSSDEVFLDPALDLASFGVWVPKRYQKLRAKKEKTSVQQPRELLLSTRELTIGRDDTAISEPITFDLHAGEIVAVVGANGSGKSTFALTLAGLLPKVSGEIVASEALLGDLKVADPNAWTSPELARRISYVFQNPEHQFVTHTVLDEVKVAPLVVGMDDAAATERAQELLEHFGLAHLAKQNPYTLSGGEKRRLTVAAALAAAPKVLLLDEPTFGQDRLTWESIIELLQDLAQQNVATIIITHDDDLIEALDARVVRFGVAKDARYNSCQQVLVSPARARKDIYIPTSSSKFLAQRNPLVRFVAAFLISLPLLLSLDMVSATVALLLELLLLWIVGINPLRSVRLSWPVFVGAPTSALAVIFYGKAGGAELLSFGFVHITQLSLMLGIATGIRILAIGIPAIIFVLGLDATALADALSQKLHLSDRFVYGGLAGMRLFNVLKDDWTSISASRRSRGLGNQSKFKTLVPQSFALLVLSIRRSVALAKAMQARGFGGPGPRSHARTSVITRTDILFLVLCIVLPCVALGVALMSHTFNFFGMSY